MAGPEVTAGWKEARITREWSQDWGHREKDKATHGLFLREAEATVQARLLLGQSTRGNTVHTFTSEKMDFDFPIPPPPLLSAVGWAVFLLVYLFCCGAFWLF